MLKTAGEAGESVGGRDANHRILQRYVNQGGAVSQQQVVGRGGESVCRLSVGSRWNKVCLCDRIGEKKVFFYRCKLD